MEQNTLLRSHWKTVLILTLSFAALAAPAVAQIPTIGGYTVRCAYVIPSDRTAQTNGVANFRGYMDIGQEWYEDQMRRNGYGNKTFRLEKETDGVTTKIHVVNVTETTAQLIGNGDPNTLYWNTRNALINAGAPLNNTNEIWMFVPETHILNSDGTLDGCTARASTIGAICSSDMLAFDPYTDMTNNTTYDGQVISVLGPYQLVQDVTYAWWAGTTFSGLTSTWIGGFMHELGHGFGINHDWVNDLTGNGNLMAMGRTGFRGWVAPETYSDEYCRLSLRNALQLNYSPFFNDPPNIPNSSSNPTAVFNTSGLQTPVDGLVSLSFTASDPDGLAFAMLYDGYGDVVLTKVLSGTNVTDTFETFHWVADSTTSFYLSVWDTLGNRIDPIASTSITVNAGYNRAPWARIEVSPDTVDLNETIYLDGGTSYDDSSTTLYYEWDFNNDGTYDTTQTTTSTAQTSFSTPGPHYIGLRVTDTIGAQGVWSPILVEVVDTVAPTPNPATFATAPNATSSTEITMTATAGSDISNPIEYYFEETSGNPGGSDSGWQTSTTYNDTGLSASTQYTYRVKMRDSANNETTYSQTANATTDAGGDTDPPTPAPSWVYTPFTYYPGFVFMMGNTATDASGVVEYYFDEENYGSTYDSGWVTDRNYNLQNIPSGITYKFRFQMRDAYDNRTVWSTSSEVTP